MGRSVVGDVTGFEPNTNVGVPPFAWMGELVGLLPAEKLNPPVGGALPNPEGAC